MYNRKMFMYSPLILTHSSEKKRTEFDVLFFVVVWKFFLRLSGGEKKNMLKKKAKHIQLYGYILNTISTCGMHTYIYNIKYLNTNDAALTCKGSIQWGMYNNI